VRNKPKADNGNGNGNGNGGNGDLHDRRVDAKIRNIAPEDMRRARQRAQARGWTVATYISRVLVLHERCRQLADAGKSKEIRDLLEELGLSTVTH
jgi:hypothetical protein